MINVDSEIMPLRRVLVHRPGNELLNIMPENLDKFLFNDIPYLNIVKREFEEYLEILRENQIEVLYLEDLMSEILDNDSSLKDKFIKQYIQESGIKTIKYKKALIKYLNEFKNNKELILKTMEGINIQDIPSVEIDLDHSLTDLVIKDNTFLIEPMPNLLFLRDNITSIGNGISLNRMKYDVRKRENIYYEYIFNYHEEYKNITKFYNKYNSYSLEGGDILNLNEHIITVGISKRTSPEAIEELAKNIFKDSESKIDTILVFNISKEKEIEHIDTMFTQIDFDKFLYYPGAVNDLKICEIKKDEIQGFKITELTGNLEEILEMYLEREIMLIPCGGGDKVASAREWFSDGINVLCIAPGIVISYNRNNITNAILRKYGVKVIEISSSELSRGKGGPRCMVAPLIRINN